MCGFNLVLNLKAGKQRYVVTIVLDQIDLGRHHQRHEVLCLFVNIGSVDENFADFIVKVIADGAHHEIAFEVNQERRGIQALRLAADIAVLVFLLFVLWLGRAIDGFPQLHQVIQVPLEFFGFAPDGCGARDHAHAVGDFEFVDDIAQLGAVLAFNAARYTATARVVGHQHQITASQTNKSGERRTLVAALVFIHLNDDFLAFAQRLLDGGFGYVDAGLEIGTGNFLERQEAVALGAVIDKGGFETGLDAGDNALIDIAFFLLFG